MSKPSQEDLMTALMMYGICPWCLEPYIFDENEPFYTCGCGTGEWGNNRPEYEVVKKKPNEPTVGTCEHL